MIIPGNEGSFPGPVHINDSIKKEMSFKWFADGMEKRNIAICLHKLSSHIHSILHLCLNSARSISATA